MIADNYSLDQLQNLDSGDLYYQTQISVLDIRLKAIQEAAESLGMQAGLYQRSQDINAVLDQHSEALDQVFNFNLLIYKQHVLPPVIEHAGGSLNLGPGSTTLRINDETYNVIRQVKFVTAPPTWRDYLWMSYQKPDLPNKVLLPRNDKERKIWKHFVRQGWYEGEDQGIVIFKINLNRLERDYTGMVLYKNLLLQGMVSPFHVDTEDYGVTGNGDHLVVGDQSMAIANFPELQVHSQLWDPVITNQNYEINRMPVVPVDIHTPLVTPAEQNVSPEVNLVVTQEVTHAPIITAMPVYSAPIKSKR